MPEQQRWTLQRLFFGRFARGSRGRRKIERHAEMANLKKQMAAELGRVKWRVIAQEITKQIGAVLDVGIADHVLLPVWNKWESLQQYRDSDKYPANESVIVPLVNHGIQSGHAPHIDLLMNGVEIGRLELNVNVGLGLEGVNLRVQDGRIWQIQAGSCTGSGQLECAFRGQSIYKIERKSRRFDLKNGITLKEGVPIPALP